MSTADFTRTEHTPIDVPQDLETPQFPIVHAQHRHRCRPPQPAKTLGRLTFLNWTALTFARWTYTEKSRNGCYGKPRFPEWSLCDSGRETRSGPKVVNPSQNSALSASHR